MRLRGSFLATACFLLLVPARSQGIGFDEFAGGVPITNEYQALGAAFNSDAGQPPHTYTDAAEATSPPNVLAGADAFSNLFIHFVNPVTGLSSPIDVARLAQFTVVSVGHAEVTVTSRSPLGVALQTFALSHP